MLTRLKLLRSEKKISQQKLADIVGVSQQAINKYENHNIEPDIATLQKMALFFEASIDYIVGFSDVRHPIAAPGPEDLTAQENALLKGYRHLQNQEKELIDKIISHYLEK